MSFHSRYDKGDWNALCDVCGRKYKASELTKRWDGLMCCSDDWEIRQPQDFVRGVADPLLTPWVRDEPSDTFIPIYYDKRPNDFYTFSESLDKNFIKVISNTNFVYGGINIEALNLLPVNTTPSTVPYDQIKDDTIQLSEVIYVFKGVVGDLTIYLTDYMSLTESAYAVYLSPYAINASVINFGALNQ